MKASFKPRARLLQLLGEQLIGSPKLAVFELVKNSYDADATVVNVIFNDPLNEKCEASIVIKDDGCGMDINTIENVWLEPGTDNRIKNCYSEIFNRVHLGEKGVGRFAVHKLGNVIELTTKTKNGKTYYLCIDWDKLLDNKYMSDLLVEIKEIDNTDEIGTSGTIIKISKLKNSWNKDDVIKLYESITSIQSPFDLPQDLLSPINGSFRVNVKIPNYEEWLSEFVSINDVLSHSFYTFDFNISDGKISYIYKFTPPQALKNKGIEQNIVKQPKQPLKNFSSNEQDGIGEINGKFYVFAFDTEISEIVGPEINKFIKPYLRKNGGIRIYRDGIRVYNYGEVGDDWLQLDEKRVKHFGSGINKALILGTINLSVKDSRGLIEKTNREGFIENKKYEILKSAVQEAIGYLTIERNPDKNRMKRILLGEEPRSFDPLTPLQELKASISKVENSEQYLELLNKVEKDVKIIRDTMVNSSQNGVHISLIYHELEKFIEYLLSEFRKKEILTKSDIEKCAKEAKRIYDMMKSFTKLVKKNSIKDGVLNDIVNYVLKMSNLRFEYHKIKLVSQFDEKHPKIIRKFSDGPLTGVLINIIDNAIYWLGIRWAKNSDNKKVFIGSTDYYNYPAIVIADNGSGFKGDPADFVKPFQSFKLDGEGMGLGLYYADIVMGMFNGELILENAKNLNFIPKEFDGAAVILVFKE